MESTKAVDMGAEDEDSYEVIASEFDTVPGAEMDASTAESPPTMPKLRRRARSTCLLPLLPCEPAFPDLLIISAAEPPTLLRYSFRQLATPDSRSSTSSLNLSASCSASALTQTSPTFSRAGRAFPQTT